MNLGWVNVPLVSWEGFGVGGSFSFRALLLVLVIGMNSEGQN